MVSSWVLACQMAQISCGRGHFGEGLGFEVSWLWGLLIDLVLSLCFQIDSQHRRWHKFHVGGTTLEKSLNSRPHGFGVFWLIWLEVYGFKLTFGMRDGTDFMWEGPLWRSARIRCLMALEFFDWFGLKFMVSSWLSACEMAQIACGRGHFGEGLGSEALWLWGFLVDSVWSLWFQVESQHAIWLIFNVGGPFWRRHRIWGHMTLGFFDWFVLKCMVLGWLTACKGAQISCGMGYFG